MLTQSREIWVMGAVWIFLGVGMTSAAWLNGMGRTLWLGWTLLSLLIAVLCILGFISEVARLRWLVSASGFDIAITVLVNFIFMPIWMTWTGVFLLSARDSEDKA